jgi:hypothetical protein
VCSLVLRMQDEFRVLLRGALFAHGMRVVWFVKSAARAKNHGETTECDIRSAILLLATALAGGEFFLLAAATDSARVLGKDGRGIAREGVERDLLRGAEIEGMASVASEGGVVVRLFKGNHQYMLVMKFDLGRTSGENSSCWGLGVGGNWVV